MAERRRFDSSFAGDLALLVASGVGLVVTMWAAVASAPVAPQPAAAMGEAIGRLVAGQNDVRRRFDHALVWDRVAPGTALFDRDALYVGPDSAATIRFEDGARLEVDESSLILVSRPPVSAGPASGRLTVDIRRGGAAGTAAGSGLALRAGKVATELGHGAAAVVRVDSQRQTRVAVSRGSATIGRAGQAAATIDAGQRRVVGRDGDLGEAESILLQVVTPAAGARLPVSLARRTIEFGWEPLAGQGAYLLEIAADAEFRQVVSRKPTTETAVAHPALPPGVYFWRVSRQTGASRASSLERRLVVVDDYPPVPYRPLADAVVDLSQEGVLVMAWGAVPDVRHYRVELARGRAFTTPLFAARVELTSWRLKSDEVRFDEGGHCLRVRADDADRADSPWSEPVCFRIVTRPVLRAPELYDPVRDGRPAGGERGSWLWYLIGSVAHAAEPVTAVTLRWEKLSGAVGYGIEISEDAEFERVVIRDSVSSNAYRFSPPARRVYYFRVRGVDAEGRDGIWSGVRPVAIGLPPPAWIRPAAGERFAFAAQPPSVVLRWSAGPGLASYVVEVASEATFSELRLTQPIASTETTYRPAQLGEYFARVAGVLNDGSRTAWSPSLSFTVYPEAPRALIPVDGTELSPDDRGQVRFRWSGRPVGGYEIVVAKDPRLAEQLARLGTKGAVADLRLNHVGPFFWRVRTTAPVSDWSEVNTAIVLPATPTPLDPDVEVASGPLPATVWFAWTPVEGAAAYALELCPAPVAARASACVVHEVNDPPFVASLAVAGEWQWRLRARGEPGVWSAWTAPRPLLVTAAAPDPVAVEIPLAPPAGAAAGPSAVMSAGGYLGWRHNLGVADGPQLGGEVSIDGAWREHLGAARLRCGYATTSGSVEHARLVATARVHELPLSVWADYGRRFFSTTWWAGLGLVGQAEVAYLVATGQPTLRQDRFALGLGLHLAIERELAWGRGFAELTAALGGGGGPLIQTSARGLGLVIGYRLEVWAAVDSWPRLSEEAR